MRRVLTLAIVWIVMWAIASAVEFVLVALFGARFAGGPNPAAFVSGLMLMCLVFEAIDRWQGRRVSRP